jgi:uncharacterized protein YoxC
MTPDDATTRIENAFVHLARSLDTLTQQVSALAKPTQALLTTTRRLGYMMVVVYVFLALALCGLGVVVWQAAHLHEQTRSVVQTNQALLTELLGRTPRQP